MTQLTGKIIWVLDDFGYFGNHIPKEDTTEHTVSKIKFAIIQEHMIKFQTDPVEYQGEQFAYNVNLNINDKGTHYTGSFSEVTDSDWTGKVSCELFENGKVFFIYGEWIEDETFYTWLARIDKVK